MNKTDIKVTCTRRALVGFGSADFRLEDDSRAHQELFLCVSGLNKHWNVSKAKRIELRLHNRPPTRDAHRFRTYGDRNAGITIKPEKGEKWSPENHGTYGKFGEVLTSYVRAAGSRDGWMEIRIIE